MHKSLLLAACSLFLAALSGCSSCKPGKAGPIGKYDIEVTLDESLKSSSILVDIVGVNGSTLDRYKAYPMENYWKQNDPLRHDAPKNVMNFVSGKSLTNSLSATDPQWDKWKALAVTHLMIMADLPPAGLVAGQGNADPRRQILPLDECNWPPKTKKISVLIQRSGIIAITPTRAPK